MTTDNITISRAALGKIVGALENISENGKRINSSQIVVSESCMLGVEAALTEARAAMEAQGEAAPEWNDENVIAYCVARGISAAKAFTAGADHPQATEPALSSNPSGEHSEPSLLGSETAPSTARAIINMDAEAQASLRHFLSAAMIFSPTWPKKPASEQQKAHGDAMHARALAAVDEWFLLHDGRAAPKLEGERTGQHINVEKSSRRRYATERERLQALADTAQQGREVEKIINEAVKRNPQAFVFKGEKK